MQQYQGLRRIFMALRSSPEEGAYNSAKKFCLRHRLAMLTVTA